jgi:hypothetical protein
MDTPLQFVWSWPGNDPASIEPTTVTVSRDLCGRWYASLAVEVAGGCTLLSKYFRWGGISRRRDRGQD